MTGDGTNSYTWDGENHLKSVGTSSFTYNAYGWRVFNSNASVTYLYDPSGQFLGGQAGGGGNSAIPLGSRELAEYQGNGANFAHINRLGSRTQTTDYAGNGGQAILYYPWGQVWSNPSGQYGVSLFQVYASLLLYDTGTDGYVPPFRYYIPEKGRWLTPDPLGGWVFNPQSFNRYAYVLNNHTNLIDPLGLQCSPTTLGLFPGTDCITATSTAPAPGTSGTILPFGSGSGGGGGGGSYCIGVGCVGIFLNSGAGEDGSGSTPGGTPGTQPSNAQPPCISTNSLNLVQRAELAAAQTYARQFRLTFGFGAGADAGAGIGPKSSSWNFGFGGSASTLVVADASGNSGFLNSVSGGFAGVKMTSAGSSSGAGAAAGPSVLVSPFSINKIAGRSGSISLGGGTGVLGGGASVTTSGAATFTFGWGAGAEFSVSPQLGTSQFIPFCHD